MLAMAAGGVEPWHADAIAFLYVLHAAADTRDEADALMAWNERRGRLHRPVAFGRMQVSVADTGRNHFHLDFARVGFWYWHLAAFQGGTEFRDNGSAHRLGHDLFPLVREIGSVSRHGALGAPYARRPAAASPA